MMSDAYELLSGALADRYTVEYELGAGGMATVYLAHDLAHDRKVAVKVMRSEFSATMGADRFVREVELTSRLEHPNILPVIESGEASGFLYYVMPFVDGESLGARLHRETQLSLEDTIHIAREVARALAHSHAQGIMHRDIKPENILLSGGHAVVADFGIARAVTMAGGEKLTQTGMAIGTPAYMSPEQAMGSKNVDHRTDIYALGCVVYEMLAGETPYTGPTAQSIIAKRLTDPVPSVRRVRTSIPEHVDAAIEKALDKTPADRFASVDEFMKALTGERPVASSRQPTTPTVVMAESRPRVRWRRWAVLSAATVSVVGIGSWLLGGGGAAEVEPVTVVMAASTVAGTDSALAPVIDVALESAMLESSHVMMLGPREIELAFEAIGRDPEAALDQATALEIARRAGAGAVIQPSVHLDEGRNARRGPDFFQVDLSVKWDAVPIGSRRAGVVVNAYNVLNTTNLDPESVVTNLQAGELFGQALAARPKRQLEVGVQIR